LLPSPGERKTGSRPPCNQIKGAPSQVLNSKVTKS
jgi:hypothetical protein